MKALIVVTSHDQLGTTQKQTGWYLSEVAHVYYPLVEGGFSVSFASPKGGIAPLDKESIKLEDEENKKFVREMNSKEGIETTALSNIDAAEYQIIFFAGGHGTMWDFAEDKDIQRLVPEVYERGGIVAAVCHGPAALVNAKLSNGEFLVKGKDVSSFTNAEEEEAQKEDIVPFLLETKLRERGANFKPGVNWANQVVISERLITGQNPMSAKTLGKKIIEIYNGLTDKEKTASQELR